MSLGHGSSVVRTGLILHLDATNVKSYPGNGEAWKDLSGLGNDFTAVNHMVLVDTINPLNRHFEYNAIDRYAILTTSPEAFDYTRTAFTVCGWVMYDNQPTLTNGVIISKWNSDNVASNEFVLGTDNTGHFRFGVNLNDGQPPDNQINNSAISSTTILPNVWYFVCGVFDNGATSIYVNGVIENTVTNVTHPEVNTNSLSYLQVAKVGGYETAPAHYSKEKVSIVQMYTQPLLAADINYTFEVQRGRHGV